MSRRGVHDQIRVWANDPDASEPNGEWLACTAAGFGALHALAEGEGASDLPPRHWFLRAQCAIVRGASPLAGDQLIGHTPLHWCAWHGAPGVAAALLAAGVSPCSNRRGETPSDICRNMLRSASSPQRFKFLNTLALLDSQAERKSLQTGIASHGLDDPTRSTRL